MPLAHRQKITEVARPVGAWPAIEDRNPRSVWLVFPVLMAAMLSVPILVIAVHLFVIPSQVIGHLLSTVLLRYLINTAVLVAGTAALSIFLGLTAAWLVSQFRFPGKRIFEWSLVLPLTIPAYICAFAYAGLLDFTGPVQLFFRNTLGMPAGSYPQPDVMNLPGVIFIMSVVFYPYVYLTARAGFLQHTALAFDLSRGYGLSGTQIFFRTALPLARPAIVGGGALVVMETLNDYGTVQYLGVDTFTTGIFRTWFSMNERGAALYLAALYLVFMAIVLFIERRLRGRAKYSFQTANYRPLSPVKLSGRKGLAATVFCALLLMFGFVFPVLQLGGWMTATAKSVRLGEILELLRNSFALAGGSVGLILVLALVIVYAGRLNPALYVRPLTKLAAFGYAVPGAVIALGIMVPLAWVDHRLGAIAHGVFGLSPGLLLSGSLFGLLFAYGVRYFAVAYYPIEAAFEKQCKNLEEISRGLGYSPLQTLIRVDVPLLRGTLLSVAILVFVDLLKELPLTLILRPFNFDTLATRAFELASDEMVSRSAPASLIIILTGVAAILLLNKLILGEKK